MALGGRELPTWFTSVVILLSPALLAALVATQAFAEGDHLALDADTVGVAAGGLVIWRTGSIIACVVARGRRHGRACGRSRRARPWERLSAPPATPAASLARARVSERHALSMNETAHRKGQPTTHSTVLAPGSVREGSREVATTG